MKLVVFIPLGSVSSGINQCDRLVPTIAKRAGVIAKHLRENSLLYYCPTSGTGFSPSKPWLPEHASTELSLMTSSTSVDAIMKLSSPAVSPSGIKINDLGTFLSVLEIGQSINHV